MNATATVSFETETCSRCGGTGNYSYCQRFGTVCFKCGGKKIVLSKRGAAAKQFYRDSFPTKLPIELAVGDRFEGGGLTAGGDPYSAICTVTEAPKLSESYATSRDASGAEVRHTYIDVPTIDRYGARSTQGMFENVPVRVIPDAATRAELKAKAIAYQATLTKAGTVKKGAR